MSSDKPENGGPEAASGADWRIVFDAYDPEEEGGREATLATGNGLFVTRAAATDANADRFHYPGTYRAGCYARLDAVIEGEPDDTESLANLPNWLPLTFRIDGGPWFRIDDTVLTEYRHEIDLKTGVACRTFVCRDDAGRHTRIRERRFASMARPHLAALRLEFMPLDWSGNVEFLSSLDAGVVNDNVERYRDYPHRHLAAAQVRAIDSAEWLATARIVGTDVRIALAVRTACDAPDAKGEPPQCEGARIGRIVRVAAEAGRTVAVEKTMALATSNDPDDGDAEALARQALRDASGFDALRRDHEAAWAGLWSRVVLDADDPDAARALRFHAFHILQTASPHTAALDVGLPARGWHGEAYRGHVFWDELFGFPFLDFRFPDTARSLLLYRYRRLDQARAAARAAGWRGAMFPWRSARSGNEVTPRHQKNLVTGEWACDNTYLQRHVGAAIALNAWRHYLATGDLDFLCDAGAEMMLEVARFWAGIAQPSADGRFEIRGVIGPDEYHDAYSGAQRPGLDNNAYTNVMAAWTLWRAGEVLDHLPAPRRRELAGRIGLRADELSLWDRISRRMYVPFQEGGIVSQFERFDRLAEFRPDMLPPSLDGVRTDWALQAIGKSTNDFQATKQADLLTLFYLLPQAEIFELFGRLGYRIDRDAVRRTGHYYLARSTHTSSLSRIVYAGALAQADPASSWRLYREALGTDLDVPKGESVSEGIHLGAMGGTLDILQRRYLGVSACVDGLRIDPAWPSGLCRVRMSLRFRGGDLDIEADDGALRIRAREGNPAAVPIVHGDTTTTLTPGAVYVIGATGKEPAARPDRLTTSPSLPG